MGQLNKENKKYSHSFQRIKDIVELLRVACPWDAKQTIHSLRPQSIEELYELTDAIDNEDWEGIKEELGDLTLHILFYAQLAKEQGRFDIYDVFKTVSDKLVRRHPHVYGSVKTKGEKEILSNWETIKQSEGKKTKSILAGVPKSAPAFSKSISIQNKAKQVGFDWTCISDVKKKYLEEWSELEEAIASKDTKHIEEEFGDVLFSLINYARFLKIDPEKALERVNKKFTLRFLHIEKEADRLNKSLNELSLEEMESLWQGAKKLEH